MKKTQINKHTEHHIGLLKAKLARLRAELESSTSKGGGPAFEIKKGGDATIVLIWSSQRGQVDDSESADERKVEGGSLRFHYSDGGPWNTPVQWCGYSDS